MTYLQDVWASRYFWIHLAMSDLRARWRRSTLGVLWAIIQPLGITILLTIVFSRLFNQRVASYGPYIMSGIVSWQCVTSCITGGSLSFVQANTYIKQRHLPLLVYVLRIIIVNLVVLGLATIALLLWCLIFLPENLGIHYLAILTFYPVLALMTTPIATSLAYITVRYRDIPHALGLILQTFWFVSPVYFRVEMFRKGGLDILVDYNPLYHLLQIIRAPLLYGTWPTLTNYLFCLGASVVFTFIAIWIGRSQESKVIFYL